MGLGAHNLESRQMLILVQISMHSADVQYDDGSNSRTFGVLRNFWSKVPIRPKGPFYEFHTMVLEMHLIPQASMNFL